MKAIKTIKLENFQSHKNTVINCDSNLVVLTGESNNGKSAVLRALNLVLANRPSGLAYVSNWAKEVNSKGEIVLKKGAVCSVTIVLIGDDGNEHTVTRLRSRDKNIYVVDGVELEAVGTSVPKQVLALTNMHECNVQSQDDPYFMLTLPAGQVASKLNELVHLDSIDMAYEHLKSNKLSTSSFRRAWDSVAAENKLKLDGLKHIPQLVEDAEEIKEMLAKHEQLEEDVDSMQEMFDTLYDNKLALEKTVPVSETDIERLHDMIEDYSDLCIHCDDMEELYSRYLDTLDGVELTVTDEDIEQLQGYCQEYEETLSAFSDMGEVYYRVKLWVDAYKGVTKQVAELETQLPEVCPTCGHELNKETI